MDLRIIKIRNISQYVNPFSGKSLEVHSGNLYEMFTSTVQEYKHGDGTIPTDKNNKYYAIPLINVNAAGIIKKYAKTQVGSYFNYRPSLSNRISPKDLPKDVLKALGFDNELPGHIVYYNGRVLCCKAEEGVAPDKAELFDWYSIQSNSFFSDNLDFIIMTEQGEIPKIPIMAEEENIMEYYNGDFALINGKFKYCQDRGSSLVRSCLKYTDANSEIKIYDYLKEMLSKDMTEDCEANLKEKILLLANDWNEGYEDKASVLKRFGFGIDSVEIVDPEKQEPANLREMFFDLVHTYVSEDNDYKFCSACGCVHSPLDTLKDMVSLDGVMGVDGEIMENQTECSSEVLYIVNICKDCGRPYIAGGDYGSPTQCRSCFENSLKYKIRRYHQNPDLKYYDYDKEKGENFIDFGADPMFWGGYGVELEVGNGGEKDDMSEQVIKLLDEEVYTMHDGSIFREEDYEDSDEYSCGGFEIITHPHTEEALLNMKWQRAFKFLLKSEYRSHDIRSCGLHIHISRCLFESDEAIQKMLYFYEVNFEDVCNFARRGRSDAGRWASRYLSSTETNPQRIRDALTKVFNSYNKCHSHDLRYKCVNLTNQNTIEVRIMRGTLNFATFMASLDFLIKIANKANEISWEDVMTNNVDKWFENFNKGTFEYMKSRGCFDQPKQYTFPQNPEEKEASELRQYDMSACVQASEQERERIANLARSFSSYSEGFAGFNSAVDWRTLEDQYPF